jgi:prepilin-type N-terminal cleavage/methylation domain-containing protein
MSTRPASRPPTARGFTLIELLCVIAIIALLSGLILPVTSSIITRAYDTKCMNNLRQIGMAANAAANDNDNKYPIVEIDSDGNIVSDALDVDAKPMDEALKPYGVTAETLKCPADEKGPKNYLQSFAHNSSYMWSPYSEDTSAAVPTVISRRRGQTTISPSRLQLASDWQAVHVPYDLGASPMIYAVYGDGHVKTTRRIKPK